MHFYFGGKEGGCGTIGGLPGYNVQRPFGVQHKHNIQQHTREILQHSWGALQHNQH
jgi:hypothetical protein